MRQLLTLLLSLGALVFVPGGTSLRAQSGTGAASIAEIRANQGIELAERELRRTTDLVAAGALPRIRLEQATADLEDARDEAILERTLFAAPSTQMNDAASADMIAAAQRRVDRQQARIARGQEIVAAGVAATSTMLPLQEELTLRQTSLDLAKLHARLLAETAAFANAARPAEIPEPALDDSELFFQGMEHYEGNGAFDAGRELGPIEFAFESKFAHQMPISAEGETEVHRALGFDHRGRVDVAVDPEGAEGIWLRQYLKLHKIPYYAFTHAIPGKATAAHIHIGPGSTRLVSTRLSSRRPARLHNAD